MFEQFYSFIYQRPTMHVEMLGPVNVYVGMGLKVLIAILLGGVIGLDRERKLKAAGIKTNVLICLGACLFTTVSILNNGTYSNTDPNRVIAQVVSGIGFLGAGAIIHGRGQVIGLTTAATVWTVAAVGVTIGSGFPFIATIFTMTVLAVLNMLGPITGYLDLRRVYFIEVLSTASVKKSVRHILMNKTEEIYEITEVNGPHEEDISLQVYTMLNPRIIMDIQHEIEDLIRVKKVHTHRASPNEVKELENSLKESANNMANENKDNNDHAA